MGKEKKVTDAEFDQAVIDLATEDGVSVIIAIPGVWELLADYYNNDAIDKVRNG